MTEKEDSRSTSKESRFTLGVRRTSQQAGTQFLGRAMRVDQSCVSMAGPALSSSVLSCRTRIACVQAPASSERRPSGEPVRATNAKRSFRPKASTVLAGSLAVAHRRHHDLLAPAGAPLHALAAAERELL